MSIQVELRHTFAGGFDLQVEFAAQSTALALFGPSGSGKSTVLSAIAGLMRPDEGRITLGERVVFDSEAGIDLPPRMRGVGLVLQDGLLFPLLSIRKNLVFGVPKRGGRLSLARVAELLEIEHLLDRPPRNLSGGERQRVALGRAVLSEPELLLCDEPFSALDGSRRRRLVPILGRLRSELEIPMVVVSHLVPEVLSLADEVVMLEAGRVEAQGPTHALAARLAAQDGGAPNFWEGTVIVDGDSARLKVGPHQLRIPLADPQTGQRVRVSVSPSHVSLQQTDPASVSSQRNRMAGKVAAIDVQGSFLWVSIDADDVQITALVTREAGAELGLAPGSVVDAAFKAAAVQILSVHPGSSEGS